MSSCRRMACSSRNRQRSGRVSPTLRPWSRKVGNGRTYCGPGHLEVRRAERSTRSSGGPWTLVAHQVGRPPGVKGSGRKNHIRELYDRRVESPTQARRTRRGHVLRGARFPQPPTSSPSPLGRARNRESFSPRAGGSVGVPATSARTKSRA